ncbi:MAG: T9SS type A sorting domain-containing protein, partial [Fulvivirga sp.]
IDIYSGIDCSSLSYEISGYRNATFTKAINGETYHIKWGDSPEGNFDWTLTESAVDPGEDCDNAIIASSGINLLPVTSNEYYWYEYTATQDGKIQINSSDDNYIYIYSGINCSSLSYETDGYNNATFTEAVNGETYFIRWSVYSGGDFNWTLTESAIAPGDNCENAITASAGTNTLPLTENRDYWYKYTATQDGKIQINSSNGKGIDIYSGIDCSSLSYEVAGYRNVTFTKAINGETYYIKWGDYPEGNFDWTLTESTIEPGDDCENAIVASSGINTVTNTLNSEIWYKYTATQDGKILINSSDDNNLTLYSGSDCSSLSYQVNGYNNITFNEAINGEVYYIRWFLHTGGGFDWTLTESIAGPGDSCAEPVQAVLGDNNSAYAKYWFEFTVPSSSNYTISSVGTATNDTYLKVYSDCAGTLIDENDDYSGLQSQLTLNLSEGEVIYILWDDVFSSLGFDWTITSDAALIDQTITFNTLNTKTYGDNDFDLTATASSGLAITYSSSNESVATINGQTVTILGAGTTTITASQSGNESFNPAPDVEQVLTIDKADQNITFSLVSDKTFGDADFDLTATTSSGLAVSYLSSNTSVATISGNTVTIVGAGTTTITASQSGNDNYHAAADVERTFTVGKANQTLTFDIADQEIGNAPFSISASSNSGLTNFTFTVIDGPASVSGSTLTLDGTEGSVEVKAMEVGNDNYNTASISTTFQVKDPSKTDQTITFSSLSNKTFGDADFELTATASSGLEVIYTSSNPEVATVNGSTVTVVGAGSTTITASQGGDANFNIATPVSQVLIVNKATQTITVELIADKAVNSSPFELVASTTSGLDLTYFVSGPATIEGNTITLDGAAGMVTVTVLQAGNENYTSAEAQVSFEVLDNLTAQTIMFESIKDQFLIDESLSLTATASSGLDVTYEIVSGPAKVNGNVVTFTGLGSVTVKASQQGNSEYLPAEPAEQSFDILQTIQSITFDNIDDQLFSNSTLELSATASSGLDVAYEILSGPAAVSGDIITFTGLGEVTVSASQAGSDAFAPATSVEQSFTIFKKEQTITFNTIDDQFFEAGSLNLSATASSGLEVSHDIVSGPATVSGNVVSFSDLGTVVVSANQAGNDSFLAAVSVEQSFDVITVTGVDGETSSLLIYPNPASNVLTIRTQQENAVIELLNLNGLVVMDIRPNAENNISHLSNGVYFLRISAGADYGVHKIIKK